MPRGHRSPPRVELIVGVAALLLAGIALALALSSNGGAGAAPVQVTSDTGAGAVADELAELRQRVEALASQVSRTQLATGRSEALDAAAVRAMVEQALSERLPSDQAATAAGGAATPAVDGGARSLAQQIQQLPFGPERDALWAQLVEQGGIDAAVEFFEQMAAAQPGSADAQTSLGTAYIQQMLQTTDENARIALGKKIDAQFDRALELQPDHWEARFRKAVGMTYGPALSGRQSEAIAQFERLVEQQSHSAPQAGFAETYLYLGRLYAQQGHPERAQQIWQTGLQRHPGDADLLGAVQH